MDLPKKYETVYCSHIKPSKPVKKCELVLISIQAPSLGVINGTVCSGTFPDLFNQQAQHHAHIQLGEELGDRLSRIPLLLTDGFPPEGPMMIHVQNAQPGPEVVQDLGAIGIAIERPRTAGATGVRTGQEQSPKGGAHSDLEVQAWAHVGSHT